MAETKPKDLLSKLADAGEEAMHRLAEVPGGSKVLETVKGLGGRLDDLQKKMRALDPLEKRVASLEKRLKALEKPKTTAARKPASKSSSSSSTKKS
jgi:hypothetical protein